MMGINERLTNLFNFMIKTAVKPAMQDSDYNKVASVQTIAAALKSVNAIYCPIFIKLKLRWLSVMKSMSDGYTACNSRPIITLLPARLVP